jgi:hypothetical protein
MSSHHHAACEAFIIDKKLDHSRQQNKKHDDWRGPRHFVEQLKKAKKPCHEVYATTVKQGVHDLIKELHHDKRAGKICVLRFYGHGGCGVQNVGGGRNFHDPNTLIELDKDGHLRHQTDLALLRRFFDPRAHPRVELHGCWVASGRKGHALLVKLAKVFGVMVIAAPIDQHSHSIEQAKHPQGSWVAAIPGKDQLWTYISDAYARSFTLDGGASKAPQLSGPSGPHSGDYHAAFGQPSQ